MPGALADGAANECGTWLVASFSAIASVGAYSRAYLLDKQLMTVNLYTNEMLFPTLVERHAKGDGPGYARALVDSLRYSCVAMLLLGTAGAGAARGVMRVFGPGFEAGSSTLVILLLVPALSTVSQIQRFALYSIDRPWLASIAGFVRLAVTLVVGAVLTWKFGSIGAAAGLVIGFIVDVTFVTSIVVRHLATPMHQLWTPREWISLAAACGLGFISARLVYNLLGYPIGIVGAGAVGAGVFLAVLLLTGGLNTRDVERVRDVWRLAQRSRSGARGAAVSERPAT